MSSQIIPTSGDNPSPGAITSSHNAIAAEPSQQPDVTTANTAPNINNITTPERGSKLCTLCQKSRNVLIRCQIDETSKWHFVCPGKCWRSVTSDNCFDGAYNKEYVYGGTWKNKHAMVSGKIKGEARKDTEWPFVRDGEDVYNKGVKVDDPEAYSNYTSRFIMRPDMRTRKGTRNHNKGDLERTLREVDVGNLDGESGLWHGDDEEDYGEHIGGEEYDWKSDDEKTTDE